jgi:hypothetical protein
VELSDFRRGRFDYKVLEPKRKGQTLKISLSRLGRVENASLGLKKKLTFHPGDLDLEVKIEFEIWETVK